MACGCMTVSTERRAMGNKKAQPRKKVQKVKRPVTVRSISKETLRTIFG